MYFEAFLAQKTLHVAIIQHKYFCCQLQPHCFPDVKLSKEVCVHHIEHKPLLLTVEELHACMITHEIHQLLHMQ